jgi:hypothetical protein
MIVIVLSRAPISGSTQQTKNHLETFLNVTSPSQHKPQQQRNRRSSGQKNPAESHRTKKSKVKENKEGEPVLKDSSSSKVFSQSETATETVCDKDS